MVEPVFPAEPARPQPRPVLGYAMVWAGATLFAVNGSVAKVALQSGLSSEELTLARSTGAFAGFGLILAVAPAFYVTRAIAGRRGASTPHTEVKFPPGRARHAPKGIRHGLRVRKRELPFLALYGVAGLAFVQWFYFLAIQRLPVGIALLIEYLAPLLIALWVRFALRRQVRRRIWVAAVLALAGLALVVEVWHGLALDGLGVAAALAGAVAFAVYVLLAERAVGVRDPLSLSFYGFLFAALFWALLEPPWRFPIGTLDDSVSLLGNVAGYELPLWGLLLWVVVLGAIVPFTLIVGALRHVPATQVALIATLEPVVAALVAWLWLDEKLGAVQLTGGGIVLVGILVAQTARSPSAERASERRPRSFASS
jgi:drug/metabolite transporter (DMT)-like permease